jgi:hypothetical protein
MDVPRIVLVTAEVARGTDLDEQPLADALIAAGMSVFVHAWDDPAVRWGDYDLALLRSTWDYMDHVPEFFAWLGATSSMTNLHNPIAPIRWSIDKHYFNDLVAAGVPVVPTIFVEPGTDPADGLYTYDRFVVKPCIGAGSRGLSSYDCVAHVEHREAARMHADRFLSAGKSIMIQPLLPSVAIDGEMPMVFFNETFSHAASKRVNIPTGGGQVESLFAPEDNRPRTPSTSEIEVARKAIRAVPRFGSQNPLLYGRVDLVWDEQHNPLVLEVELAEPSLFFPQAPDAVHNFVNAISDILS